MPEGFKVDVHRVRPQPGLVSSRAGVWLAHLGASNDEPEAALDRVVGDVERLLAGPRPSIAFAKPSHLSSLLKPELPPLTSVSGLLVWTLDATALASAPNAPALVQRLLRRLHVISGRDVTQCVFVVSRDAAAAAALFPLIHELGLELRTPVSQDRAVLAEVHRPDGVIISGLLGAPLSLANAAASGARDINLKKDAARDDRDALARLEQEELRALEARL
ncbi:MAG TPA: hypothetical protein VMG12_35945, partial [Polyangiaceae bacterium]|nr:hypothetical protein [Polyangiaceae bacterium]